MVILLDITFSVALPLGYAMFLSFSNKIIIF